MQRNACVQSAKYELTVCHRLRSLFSFTANIESLCQPLASTRTPVYVSVQLSKFIGG